MTAGSQWTALEPGLSPSRKQHPLRDRQEDGMDPGEEPRRVWLANPPCTPDCAPRRGASHRPSVDPTDMGCIYVAKKPLNQASLSLVAVHESCACR